MIELLDATRLQRCNTVDCRPPVVQASPPRAPTPVVDYMAKDYDSLLRVLLDQLPARVPGWRDRSEADLGMAILELFAYMGDQLSYYQDRVAAEGWLRTATQYESVRKLLRLIDYRLDPGAAARVILRYRVTAPTFLPAGHRVSTLAQQDATPVVFETDTGVTLHPSLDVVVLATAAPSNAERTEVQLAGALVTGVLNPGAWLFFAHGGNAEWAAVADASVAGAITTVRLTAPLRADYPAGATVMGNGVAATHGESDELRAHGTGLPSQRHVIERAPITYSDDGNGSAVSSISVQVDGVTWVEVEDFVDSSATDTHYRLLRDNAGFATVEFGDGQRGRVPPVPPGPNPPPNIVVGYRIGLGDEGFVAANTITAFDPAAPLTSVTNPMPSVGARAPQALAEARLVAPQIAGRQQRAVTADDYAGALLEGVRVGGTVVRPLHARAEFRWTGSWTTVFVSIDLPGRQPIATTPALRDALELRLAERRMAGFDVELRDADYVPLHIGLVVNVRDGYFARLVREAVERAIGKGTLESGAPAFFSPLRFGFGDAVYLSDLYAAVMAVEGVASVQVTRFKQLGDRFPDREADGMIPVGPLAIARLDNDPAQPELGVLFVRACGGKEG